METLELENKFIEIKNSVNAFNTRLDETKESINILKKQGTRKCIKKA